MSKSVIGYCTNVHAGENLTQAWENLRQHALGVKERFSPTAPMGVGLWLSASTAQSLLEEKERAPFRDWLSEVGLRPFTFNGFPYGDFHQDVVQRDVYLPTWFEPARLEYTRNLVRILDDLLEDDVEGSISTLPIAWGNPALTDEQFSGAAMQLRALAEDLANLEKETGRLIHVCIEPEPGCALQRSEDIVRFFEQFLLPGGDEDRIHRHLRVCHDVCHAVVMFEEQKDVLQRYQKAGILVGKVQVSSAVCARFDQLASSDHAAAWAQLKAFDEPRYLHQTMVRDHSDAEPVFYENLPDALTAHEGKDLSQSTWHVHFHVPIYLDHFGDLQASRQAILDCLQDRDVLGDVSHFEAETYAWGVLPEELRVSELSEGIAKELQWLQQNL